MTLFSDIYLWTHSGSQWYYSQALYLLILNYSTATEPDADPISCERIVQMKQLSFSPHSIVPCAVIPHPILIEHMYIIIWIWNIIVPAKENCGYVSLYILSPQKSEKSIKIYKVALAECVAFDWIHTAAYTIIGTPGKKWYI